MTWLTGWNYRKPVTVSNTGSTLTNYQILVTTDTANLITAKTLSNCNDIRFTSSDGLTNLNYWIESGCNTSSTKIWVKIPSIANGNNTIYLYYGNSGAASASSGTNTFIQFTDFSSSTGWNLGAGWSVSGGIASFTGASQTALYSTTPVTESQYRVKAKVRRTGNTNVRIFMGAESNNPFTGNSETGSTLYSYGSYANSLMRYNNGNVYTGIHSSFTFNDMTWYDLEIIIDEVNTKYISNAYLSGAVTPTTTVEYNTKGSGTGNLFGVLGVASEPMDIDLVHVRKYTATEPTVSTGSEEIQTCNAPSANLVVLEMVLNQLLGQYPSYIDLDTISKLIDNLGDNKT